MQSNSESIKHIQRASSEALARISTNLGVEVIDQSAVQFLPREDFYARAYYKDGLARIDISIGCVQQIDELWATALQSNILIDEDGKRIETFDGKNIKKDYLVHLSMTWLILHEILHIHLGHLEIIKSASISECDVDLEDNEAGVPKEHWSLLFSDDEKLHLRPCLELQADSEATEVLFGPYDEKKWVKFRLEASAIFVVMTLMERTEQAKKKRERRYPLVATRFFTMFSQLFQYWLYEDAELISRNGESFVRPVKKPDGEAFRRYMKFVLALTINDVVQIAHTADAKSFLEDLGGDASIFPDIYQIQYADDLNSADLQSVAAKEWRKLLPLNEKAMMLSGLRDHSDLS